MTRPVDAEYAALAPGYDRDWAAYNAATAGRTLAALSGRVRGRVLDVGCGTGVLLERLPDFAVGLDRSAAMLTRARRRLPHAPLVVGDAAALPFPDASFDAAVTTSALHYLDDPAAAVRELARVTKPGGTVVWTDWDGASLTTRAVCAWLRLTGRPLGTVSSADGMAATLTDAGLQEVTVDRWRHGALWGLATASGRTPGRR